MKTGLHVDGVDQVDRRSPLPFYAQLKQILLDYIDGHALKPGDRLPGDHQLGEQYDVSRTVVRQALSELEAEGIIERVKGRGTFLAQRKTDEGLVRSVTGLYQQVTERGSTLRSDVRRLEVVPADAPVAKMLQIEPRTPVTLLERLRYVDSEPWVLTITYIPLALAPGLANEDFTQKSLYGLLQGKYGLSIVSGRRTLEASAAGPPLARSLGIKPGDPVIVLRSVVFDERERPIESFVAYHRADRSRFVVDLGTRSATEAGPLRVFASSTDNEAAGS
jgi:GntR family transcriptional regulator